MRQLTAADPNISVVVFTHHNSVLADVATMLRSRSKVPIFGASQLVSTGML